MSITFYQQFAQALQQKQVVLATVVQTRGSVPREVGAKMLIDKDSNIISTIGGGAGEAKVVRQALIVLETGVKQFVEIDLSGAKHRETQGICGGWMQIWLERWSKESLSLVQDILNILETAQSSLLITPLNATHSPYLKQTPSSIKTAPEIHLLQKNSAGVESFVEPLIPPPALFIVGAGHVAVPLSQIAQQIGFRVIIQDDRPEFANSGRFPKGAIILPVSIISALEQCPLSAQTYSRFQVSRVHGLCQGIGVHRLPLYFIKLKSAVCSISYTRLST